MTGPNVPDTTLAWLAALIDGEGSIMLQRRAPSRRVAAGNPALRNNPHYRAIMAIANTDFRLMQAIGERTGITRVYSNRRLPPLENHKLVCYYWRAVADECRVWLPPLLPWLVVKREQALLLLEALRIKDLLTTRKGERHIPAAERDGLVGDLGDIADRITKLNTRGRIHLTGEGTE